jgi:hypothetical protein
MSLCPEVQAEAQSEIDRVVGRDRLPEVSDRPDLPYLNALCKEVFRWHNAVPTGESIGQYIPVSDLGQLSRIGRVRILSTSVRDIRLSSSPGTHSLFRTLGELILCTLCKLTSRRRMTHDPERYANPMAFDPTRFIATATREAEQDPARICFGYGRR